MKTFFLLVVAPALALVLGILGVEAIPTNPMGWFHLIIGVGYLVGVVIMYWIRKERFWESNAGGEVVSEESSDRSYWLMVLGMLVIFFIAPLEYLFYQPLLPRVLGIFLAGLLLAILGTILFVWARRSLEKNYSSRLAVTSQQTLVQTGAYRLLRHPAYSGFLLMGLGIGVGYASLGGLAAVLLLLLPGLAYRIHIEEKILLSHFGEQYRAYAAHTARLIPWIW